jgi:transcriptional regulator with XRE-family HTH domain
MEECDYYGDSVSTLGERISVAREHAGLSEDELAARLAVRRRTIDDWEGDGAEPRANKLAMLAGILGVSPAWLLSGAGEGVPAPDTDPTSIDDTTLRLRLASELREAVKAHTLVQQRITRIADALAAID